jgi:arylsulfatase
MSGSRITRKQFLRAGGAVLSTAVLGASASNLVGRKAHAAQGSAPPNILFICVDQMRSLADVPSKLPLPNFERLVEEGRRFDNYHVHQAPCGPSRSVIYTGQHVQKTGMYTNPPGEYSEIVPGSTPLELPAGFPTIGTMLREHGYYTAYKGKWHLSLVNQKARAAAGGGYPNASNILEEYGFSQYNHDGEHTGMSWVGFGHDGVIAADSINLLYDFANGFTQGKPWFLAVNFINPHDIMFFDATGQEQGGGNRLAPVLEEPRIPFYEQDWGFPLPRSFHEDDLSTKPAAQRPPVGPGFGRLDRSDEAAWRKFQNYYFNCIRDVDRHIGSVLEALDRFRLASNTIVVLTSDHGERGGAHGILGKGADVYKETLRVPLIIRHPDVPGGRATSALAGAVDLVPTLLGFAGVSDAERRERYPDLRGINLAAALTDPAARTQRDELGILFDHMTPGNLRPEAKDERRTLLRGVFDGRYKFARYFSVWQHHQPKDWRTLVARNDLELYDTASDPDEIVNLAHQAESRRDLILSLNAKVNVLIDREVGADDGSVYPGETALYTASSEFSSRRASDKLDSVPARYRRRGWQYYA